VRKLNQIYKKNEYLVIQVSNGFLIININKVFKKGHTHVKNLDICKSLISLAINKKLPQNIDFVDNLIRISVDKSYIKELRELKDDKPVNVTDLMQASYYKRHRGAVRQVR
jgi:hypothetical protein